MSRFGEAMINLLVLVFFLTSEAASTVATSPAMYSGGGLMLPVKVKTKAVPAA